MALPKILRMLFANDGAGPKLRSDIIGITVNNEEPDSNGNFNVEIPEVDTSALVVKSGDRGALAGYETSTQISLITTGGEALVINDDSPDAMCSVSVSSVTVENGTAGKAWVKVYSLTSLSFQTITLGSAWSWVGGEVPTIEGGGMLVLAWNGSKGIANYIYDGLETAES